VQFIPSVHLIGITHTIGAYIVNPPSIMTFASVASELYAAGPEIHL